MIICSPKWKFTLWPRSLSLSYKSFGSPSFEIFWYLYINWTFPHFWRQGVEGGGIFLFFYLYDPFYLFRVSGWDISNLNFCEKIWALYYFWIILGLTRSHVFKQVKKSKIAKIFKKCFHSLFFNSKIFRSWFYILGWSYV